MPRQKLKPGEYGEIFVYPHKADQYRAKARVRLFDGGYSEVSRVAKTAEAARLAVQTGVADRLQAGSGTSDLKPDSKVGLACRQWINEQRTRSQWPNAPIRPQTIDEYERLLAKYLIGALGKCRLNELTPRMCQEWLNGIIEQGKRGPNDLVVTATQIRTVFRSVLDRAIVHDVLRYNPVDKTEVPKRKVPEPKALTAIDIHRLREAVRAWEDSRTGRPGPKPTGNIPAAIDVMLGTGMRIGEVLALTWDSVSLDPDGPPTVTVEATMVDIKGTGTIRQAMPKTDAGKRTIIIPKFTVESLQAIKPENITPDMPVFASRRFKDGQMELRPQSPANLRRTLRSALELAEMKGEVHPHLLRSTVATFVARERGIADAAMLLGHRISGGVTVKHYIERLQLAPDVSSVLQTVIEIGEEQAKVEACRSKSSGERAAEAPAGHRPSVPAGSETGW